MGVFQQSGAMISVRSRHSKKILGLNLPVSVRSGYSIFLAQFQDILVRLRGDSKSALSVNYEWLSSLSPCDRLTTCSVYPASCSMTAVIDFYIAATLNSISG